MPKCAMPSCSNNVELGKSGKWKIHCSLKCRGQHNSIIGTEKRKQTCIEKFGSTTNLTSDETRSKIKKTLMEKYGVEHQMHVQSIKDQIKTTCLKTYGVDNPSKSSFIKDKKVKTSLDHYGTPHPLQSTQVQEMRKLKSLDTYGVDHYSKTPQFKTNHPNQFHILPENLKKLRDPVFLLENNDKTCSYIANLLGVTKDTVAKSYRRLDIEHSSSFTTGELEIVEYISSIYSGPVVTRSRKVISPQEIDIYLPELKIGFEFDGIYWHSESNNLDRKYHYNKTHKCNELGIRLIHIFENEWLDNKEIVKSRISNLLNVNRKIYARNCKIVQLSVKEYIPFFNSTHIQGSANATVCYGLIHCGELVAAMSFVRPRFSKGYSFELLRFSNALYTSVVGGASKLFTHLIKMYSPDSIVSYSDLRWNTGTLYTKLGFALTPEFKLSYKYTKDYKILESRHKYQKKKLRKILPLFDKSLSEWENMKNNGYDRIWDCGNAVYVWIKPQAA